MALCINEVILIAVTTAGGLTGVESIALITAGSCNNNAVVEVVALSLERFSRRRDASSRCSLLGR